MKVRLAETSPESAARPINRLCGPRTPSPAFKILEEPRACSLRSFTALAAIAFLAAAIGFAQSSGEAIYLNGHSREGLAASGIGKFMKIKPATDPGVIKLIEPDLVQKVHLGIGKMQRCKGE
jgi:hypothetical protein